MFYHDNVMKLICFAEKHFWTVTYDEVGTRILEEYDKLGMTMTYTFTFVVTIASFNYIFAPFFGTVFAFTSAVLVNIWSLNIHVRTLKQIILFICS